MDTHDHLIQALTDLESPRELCRIYRGRAEYAAEQLTDTGCRPIPVPRRAAIRASSAARICPPASPRSSSA